MTGMAPPVDPKQVAVLIETATSTLTLLRRFSSALADPSTPASEVISSAPDPLNVLHDASKLLKAHTTKLSLLTINKPFTPSAIRKVISETAGTCLPAMMSAVEICRPAVYGRTLNGEVRFRVRKVFREYEDMMEEVVSLAKAEADGTGTAGRSDAKGPGKKDSLASTGVVWQACDSIMELKALGMVGLVVRKAEEYRDTLEDALSELREWGEDEEVEGEDGDTQDGAGDCGSDDDDSVEDMLMENDRIPKGREDLRRTLDTSLKKLKLVSTLYQALIKRRLKTMKETSRGGQDAGVGVPPAVAGRADEVLDKLKSIPDQVDELASSFYDLDDGEARQILETICKSGKEVIGLTRIDWSGKEDEFSAWSDKWKDAIDRA